MIKTPKNANNYTCETCNFKCSKLCDYNRHILTAKHKILTNPNEKTPKNAKAFMCSCGKVYKQAPSLTRHKKKCTYIEEDDTDSNDDTICEHDTVVNEIDIIPSLPNTTHISDSVALINIIKENQEFKNGNEKIRNSQDTPMVYFKEVYQEPGSRPRGALDNKYKFIGVVKYHKYNWATEKDRKVIKFVLEIVS